MLTGLPEEDQQEMRREEKIEVRCEFCNAYISSHRQRYSAIRPVILAVI